MTEIVCSSESSNSRPTKKPAVHAANAAKGARRRNASGPIVTASPASSSNVDGRSYDGSPNRYKLMNVRDEPTATASTATASATSVTIGWDAIHAHTRRTVLTTSNVPTGGPALIGLKTDLSQPCEATTGHRR